MAAVVTWLLTWAQGIVMAWASERISADLRNHTYAHLQRLSLEFFGGKRTGDLMARISTDTERICYFLSDNLVDFTTDVLMIVGTAVILLSIESDAWRWRPCCRFRSSPGWSTTRAITCSAAFSAAAGPGAT